jgi:hypothetical protein
MALALRMKSFFLSNIARARWCSLSHLRAEQALLLLSRSMEYICGITAKVIADQSIRQNLKLPTVAAESYNELLLVAQLNLNAVRRRHLCRDDRPSTYLYHRSPIARQHHDGRTATSSWPVQSAGAPSPPARSANSESET